MRKRGALGINGVGEILQNTWGFGVTAGKLKVGVVRGCGRPKGAKPA